MRELLGADLSGEVGAEAFQDYLEHGQYDLLNQYLEGKSSNPDRSIREYLIQLAGIHLVKLLKKLDHAAVFQIADVLSKTKNKDFVKPLMDLIQAELKDFQGGQLTKEESFNLERHLRGWAK